MTPSADTKKRDPKEVKRMFARVAKGYDFVNHAMCFGLDILWRSRLVKILLQGRRAGGAYLDVACGSGDVAVAVAEADEKSKICGVDFCAEMLDAAKAKAAGKNLSGRIEFAEADCSSLPFADETFDGAAISFGFRNFKDRKKCLEEIFRVLKPGGKIAMLEVARANKFIAPAQKFFMWHLVPAIAKICGSDPRDYKYLAKTTLEYPSNPEVAGMFSESGFKNVAIKPQGFGLVAITHAVKPSPAGKSGK